jgi:hypothetical protein
MAREKSDIQRKFFGIRLDPALMKQVKIVSAKMDTNSNLLIEKCIRVYLKEKGHLKG